MLLAGKLTEQNKNVGTNVASAKSFSITILSLATKFFCKKFSLMLKVIGTENLRSTLGVRGVVPPAT